MILFLLSILSGLVLVEGGIRVHQWLRYGTTQLFVGGHFTTDPSSGLRIPVAGTSTRTIQINALGFRGPELEPHKAAGQVRLAFLGASTTFCSEVSSNCHTWPHLVWEALQEQVPDIAVDYVNAAVPGYTVTSSLQSLRWRVKPLQPDVIVIYHATNDLAAASRIKAQERGLYQKGHPSWLADRLLFWQYVQTTLQLAKIKRHALQEAQRLVVDPQELSRPFRSRVRELIQASQAVAPVVAIATFSYKIRREQSAAEQFRAAHMALQNMPYMSVSGLLEGYEEYNRVIRDVATETGAILIDDALTIPGDDTHFSDSFHFLDAGSALMAQRVVGALVQAEPFQYLLRSQLGS
jgi:lysophospholipase L1-like esterase